MLQRCLDSVLQQRLQNIEHILIDDGSTDGSGGVLDAYAREHPQRRIVVIHQANAGIGAARNCGLHSARGTYVAFLDSDDYLSENFCQALYASAVAGQADIAKGECIECLEDEGRFKPPSRENRLIRRVGSKLAFVFYFWTAIYRRQMLSEHGIYFDPALTTAEDLLFQNEALLACGKLALTDKALYYYTVKTGSTTQVRGGLPPHKAAAIFESLQHMTANLYRHQLSCDAQGLGYVTCRLILWMFNTAGVVRDPADAQRCISQAQGLWRNCPAHARAFLHTYLTWFAPRIAAQLELM